MTGSRWSRYSKSQADGTLCISPSDLAALERDAPDRVIEALIGGRPARIVFLDAPYRIAEEDRTLDAFHLRRFPIRDVSAWPPKLAARIKTDRFYSIFDCSVKSTRFIKGRAPEEDRVEFDLEGGGQCVTAWLTGGPAPLLKCVATTINQHAGIDNRIVNLQEVHLRSWEEGD